MSGPSFPKNANPSYSNNITSNTLPTKQMQTNSIKPHSSKFYFQDEEEDEDQFDGNSLLRPSSFSSQVNYHSNHLHPSASNNNHQQSLFQCTNEILNFPTESTNAYSYAHLSPNSLALRLNVLKRSLEILIERPELILSLQSVSPDALSESPPQTPINNTNALFNPKIRSPSSNKGLLNISQQEDHLTDCKNPDYNEYRSLGAAMDPLSDNGSHSLQKQKNQIKIETNASSAALAAFFRENNPPLRRTSTGKSFASSDNSLLSPSSGSLDNANNPSKFTKRSSSLNTPFLLNNVRIKPKDVEMYSKSTRPLPERSLSTASMITRNPNTSNQDVPIYENIRDKLKSMIKMLSSDGSGSSQEGALALNLHNLSLSNMNDESKEQMLQRKLLYALATPFYESISTNNTVNLNRNISSAASCQHNNNHNHYSTIEPKYLTASDKRRISSFSSSSNKLALRLEPPVRIPLKKFSSFDDSAVKSSPPVSSPQTPDDYSVSFSNLRPTINFSTTRPFHSLSTSKNSSPQAIITCDTSSPWKLRAVNDLSTLIFGIKNKGSEVKRLGLMDLIADNSKDFVLQKLMKRLAGDKDNQSPINRSNHYNKDIIFAGEIVAVKSQVSLEESDAEQKEIQWCSLWAKKKNEMIILMFDKIPCSAIDLSIVDDGESWKVTKINEVTGKLMTGLGYCDKQARSLNEISKSLDKKLQNLDSASMSEKMARINDNRYFTLNLQHNNLPCAVLSSPVSDKEMVLKIHTLPYIAGIFIISASNYNILSYNRSISKNLFGHGDLIGQPINTIIPNFTKLIEYSSSTKKMVNFLNDLVNKSTPERVRENPKKYLLPGLVLPEHFFRRIQAKFEAHRIVERRRAKDVGISNLRTPIKLKIDSADDDKLHTEGDDGNFHDMSEEEIEDELFLNSKGIYGRHSDGSKLVVDVQLRVSSIDTLVLWVTYSNELYGAAVATANAKDDRASMLSEKDICSPTRSVSAKKKVKFTNEDKNEADKKLSMGFADPDSDLFSKASSSSLVSLKYNINDSETLLNTNGNARSTRSNSLLSDLSDGLSTYSMKDEVRNALDSGHEPVTPKRREDPMEDDDYDEFDSTTEVSTPPTTAPINDIKSINDNILGDEASKYPMSSTGTMTSVDGHSAIEEDRDDGSHIIVKSEEELIAEENLKHNEWKAKCLKFPMTIGAKRRKKSISEFHVIKGMGQGAYGKVLLCYREDDPNYEIILKCIYKERILVDSWTRDRKLGTVPAEIQIMAFLNYNPHPNTLKLIDFFEDDECFYVELPIHGSPPAMDLFDYIEIKKALSEIEIQYIFRQIVQSINHLHENGIVHRDIKDENVIVDEHSVVKLIDYGSSAFLYNGPFDVFVGTMEYAPPEVLHGSSYDGRPQDVWSLGVLLYTMVYKENPFYNVDEIMEGELKVPYILSEGCISLITRILNRDVEKRPTVKEILEDSWLKF
ncbi:serine/threonine protein kinase [Saccharomycopsis crataegensis]|uniref:non-specific serine/threonine protein kinase n=1 Tax=Saccharomycopsis crataegensis TaxID=43959 RepID=A0AAV5QDR3_9ASCO|nr:serine/threonine protein kinase [Saccharomycopsis crataegensis]